MVETRVSANLSWTISDIKESVLSWSRVGGRKEIKINHKDRAILNMGRFPSTSSPTRLTRIRYSVFSL